MRTLSPICRHPRWHWLLLALLPGLLTLVATARGVAAAAVAAAEGDVAPSALTDWQEPGGPEPQVLVVTLSGKLGTQELARCTRTLREAEDSGARSVVFVLDRDTGAFTEDQEDLQSLFDRVQGTEVETITLVRGRATQGACYLALLTDRTFFERGAQIGEITKPEKDFGDFFAMNPDSAMAQRLDAVKAALKDRLDGRKTKLRPDAIKMAMAMADPRMQLYRAVVRESGLERTRLLEEREIVALQGGGAKVIDQQPLTRPLFVTAAEAEEAGISVGTVDGLEHLARDVLLVDPAVVKELEVNWAEDMIAWLEILSPFLLIGGFLLILVEVKAPGFGLPGILGIAFLGLSMFHSYLVGLAEITEILLFFLGIAALAVEIFLLPGMLIFGAIGFLCLVLSLLLSKQSFIFPSNEIEEAILLGNLINLTVMFVLVVALGMLLWRLLPKVPMFNRLFLPPPKGDSQDRAEPSGLGIATEQLAQLVGRVGRSVTVLRPTGTMDLDGQRYDVVTEGEFHEIGTELRVLYVQGNRVVVGAHQPPPDIQSDSDAAGRVAGGDRGGEAGSAGVAVLLAIVGLALIVAEVFFVSFGVIAILAGASLVGAILVAFQDSVSFGVTMLVVEAIAAPAALFAAFRILPKTPFGRQLILSRPENTSRSSAGDPGLGELLDKTGVTLSDLRPAGFARIDGRKVDVTTRGELIVAGRDVVVIDVSANRVLVAERQ
ncbi:MAG: hypothetical protein NXI31_25995 [bacterium]|nr:hypothetical protein [bacterium]